MLVTRDILHTAEKINKRLLSLNIKLSKSIIGKEKPIFLTLFSEKLDNNLISREKLYEVLEKINIHFAVVFEGEGGYYHIIGYANINPFHDVKKIDDNWNLLYMKNDDTYCTIVNIFANNFSKKYWYFYSKNLNYISQSLKFQDYKGLKEVMKSRLNKLNLKL